MSRAEKVAKVFEKEMPKPYKLGEADCFLTALALVDAIQGSRHRKEYAGIYHDDKSIARAMANRGHKSVGSLIVAELALEEIPAGDMQLGDIAVVKRDGGEHVAVHSGSSLIVKDEHGLSQYDYSAVLAAFRV